MHEEKLKKLGLTSGEARAYLCLLELGSSTVGPIIKKSGIAYSKIYDVLGRLIEKGLVSFIVKDKTKYFRALEPSRLQEYLQKKEKELSESKHLLNEIMPFLKTINSESKHPEEAEVFIGEKGIATAYELLLKRTQNDKEMLFFYVHDPDYDERVNEFYFGIWSQLRKMEPSFKKSKIKMRGIINRQNFKIKMNRNLPSYMDQRLISIPLPGNMDIGEDTTLILSWGQKPLAVLIRSREIAKNFRTYFESIWEIAEKDV